MDDQLQEKKAWMMAGKTIKQLISELESFEDLSLIVELSFDGGVSSKPISLIGRKNDKCIIMSID